MTSSTDPIVGARSAAQTASGELAPIVLWSYLGAMVNSYDDVAARLVAAEAALADAERMRDRYKLAGDAIERGREHLRTQLADANGRIEEMTADQPAIRADERTRIATEIEDGALPGCSAAGYYSSYDHAGYAEAERDVVRWLRESPAASSVPGLSVCVAQLAAIRQLAKSGSFVTWTNRVAIYADDLFAVLDGVPGTTQATEDGNEADS